MKVRKRLKFHTHTHTHTHTHKTQARMVTKFGKIKIIEEPCLKRY